MKIKKFTLLIAASGLLLLSGCGMFSKSSSTAPPKPVELSELMDKGADFDRNDHKAAALKQYEEAALLYPTSKLPWLKIAQMQFESNNYGEAIVAAQQVVARDATDKVATSILSVSGLRIATKAVADLTKNQALVGSIRTEARQLADVLRESLGENVLVPVVAVKPRPAEAAPQAIRPTNTSSAAVKKKTIEPTGSPFGSLR